MKSVLLKLFMLLALTAYLVYAFVHYHDAVDQSLCEGVDIVVADSAHAGFITSAEAERILREAGDVYPVGKPMSDVSCRAIEDTLLRNPFVQEAVCFKTSGGRVRVSLAQRLPLLRVMADDGDDYYLDDEGYVMESMGYVANLAVATGAIDRHFSASELSRIGRFLRANGFWDSQVEQILVRQNQNIDIIPRVGDQIIHIGTADSLSKKFRNLMAFYKKVMPEVGWNKYSEIDVTHPDQIVCVKRKK
ncbi:MAG: cell division protein [Alloprevotella sp.]|nr:cell division protein [Alloprevotella sp.]MBR1653220.1 cell division protein [Alloprevotella sp.]